MMAQQRKCPFCEEIVINDARVCHFCGREIPTADGGPEESGARAAWRTGRTFLVIVVVALALVALTFAIRGWLAAPIPLPIQALLGSSLLAG